MTTNGPNEDVLNTLVHSINTRNLEHLVSCFADDYLNETPAHPHRGFPGNEQVRQNRSQLFAAVPDLRAEVHRTAARDEELWTEWEMSGTRTDKVPLHLRGVVIFRTHGPVICSARFYLEPVEHASGDIQAALSTVLGHAAPSSDREEPS